MKLYIQQGKINDRTNFSQLAMDWILEKSLQSIPKNKSVAFDFMLIVKDSAKGCSDLQWLPHELLPLCP